MNEQERKEVELQALANILTISKAFTKSMAVEHALIRYEDEHLTELAQHLSDLADVIDSELVIEPAEELREIGLTEEQIERAYAQASNPDWDGTPDG